MVLVVVTMYKRVTVPSVNPGQIDWEAVESEFAEYYCADDIRKQRTSGEILHPCPCWTVARHWVWIRVSGWKMSGYDSLGMGITVGPTANSSLIVGQN